MFTMVEVRALCRPKLIPSQIKVRTLLAVMLATMSTSGTDCGVSKETYAMYINQGKISYIMVLFKSGLYAMIVLAIIWRRKVLSGSC